MNDTTIVTFFFDINRKNFKGFERSNDKYFEYFKFWARIKNKLIIYTDTEESAKRIKKIRKDFDREKETKIIILDDIFSIFPDMYSKIQDVSNKKEFHLYRYMENSADNNPKYDYVMFLKTYLVNDAVKRLKLTGLVAYVDFGFNHGGGCLLYSEEFDFLWEPNVPLNKITYLAPVKDNDIPIFHVVESYKVYIWGFVFVLPSSLSEKLLNLMIDSMNSLLDCGFMDDDQTLMFMAYRKDKKLFNIVYGNGFDVFNKITSRKLSLVDKSKQKEKLKDRVLRPYRIAKRNHRMHKNMKELFDKDYLD